jgi:hypothetical protein
MWPGGQEAPKDGFYFPKQWRSWTFWLLFLPMGHLNSRRPPWMGLTSRTSVPRTHVERAFIQAVCLLCPLRQVYLGIP